MRTNNTIEINTEKDFFTKAWNILINEKTFTLIIDKNLSCHIILDRGG